MHYCSEICLKLNSILLVRSLSHVGFHFFFPPRGLMDSEMCQRASSL